MSQISDIVQITISRETQSVATANFGTPGIIGEFATSKTTTPFVRYREYASITEMVSDGWGVTDPIYNAANAIFSQNPKPEKVMIGRKDSGDASWSAALTAIQTASQDWYAFTAIKQVCKFVFSADFVASNSIALTINGVAVTPKTFSTDQATTMGLLETEVEADLATSTATIDPDDATNRTLIVELAFGDIISASAVVTGGASQATATVYFLTKEQTMKDVAAWVATQKKLYFLSDGDTEIYDSGVTDDIASYMKSQSYDRTVVTYYPHTTAHYYIETAWMGEALPYDPGSQTWAFKRLTGVAAYNLTSAQRTAILNKNCNIYTTTGGVPITEKGNVASGEWIDVMIGIDWLEARIGENIYSELVNSRKIPFTDPGISVIEGLLKEVLDEAVKVGLINDDYVVTVPLAADVSSANKIAGILPDVEFTATLQGAIQKITIVGTVTF